MKKEHSQDDIADVMRRKLLHHCSVSIQEIEKQGRGLFNSSGTVIPKDTIISTIPIEECWSLDLAAQDESFMASIGSELSQLLDQETTMALYLLFVKHTRTTTPESYQNLASHLNQLPQTYTSSPFFPVEALTVNCSFSQLTNKLLQQLAQDYASIITRIPWNFSLSEWKWAVATIQSRSMDFLYQEKSVRLLVPSADMLNHSFTPNAIHRLNASSLCVEIVSVADIAVNDQVRSLLDFKITISYGNCSNARLLQLYGFIVAGNPFDTFDLFLSTHPSAMWYDEKKAIVASQLGVDLAGCVVPIPLSNICGGIDKALQYLRIQRADSENLMEKVKQGLAVGVVDASQERDICLSLMEALKGIFDGIQVESEPQESIQEMEAMQVYVGFTEKKILGAAIMELGKRMQ